MSDLLAPYSGAQVVDPSRITANMPPINFTANDPTYRASNFLTFTGPGVFTSLVYNGRPAKLRLISLSMVNGGSLNFGSIFAISVTSTANTGGTAGTIPIVTLGPIGAVAADSIPYIYTVGPTLGIQIGQIYTPTVVLNSSTGLNPAIVLDYSTRNTQPPILWKTGMTVFVYNYTAFTSGITVAITYEWTEAQSGRGIGP